MASPPFPSLTSVFMTVEDSKVRFGNEAVLYAIACEIESIGTDTAHKSQQVSSGDNDSNGSSSSDRSDGRKSFDFRLEGFLTRPRVCNKLFPPHIQRERYSMISVQERLIMLSVEPSLTICQEQSGSDKAWKDESSSPGKGALLVAALEVLEYTLFPLDTNSDQKNFKSADPSPSSPSCPVERILYISKVDSSGCWPSCGINTHGLKSPARVLVSGYLKAMRLRRSESDPSSSSISVEVNSSTSETVVASAAEPTSETAAQMSSLKISPLPNKETEPNSTPSTNITETTTTSGTDDLIERYHVKKTSIYVFARAQPQYLFRDSAKNPGKHVLSDRDLVRWWKNMIASTYGTKPKGIDNGDTATDSQPLSEEKPQEINISTDICGWWLIPGIGSEREALRVIQSSHSTSPLAWTYGHPHKGSWEMAQSLIPQFPDDPKSRMMQSAMSNHGKVDIDTFWELAAIGEESGSGKITGYFRVDEQVSDEEKTEETKKPSEEKETEKSLEGTENPSEEAEETEETKQKKKVKKNVRMDTLQLGAKVADEFKKVVSDLSIHALSDKRGTTSDFTKVINKLLDLDFSDSNVAVESTRRWRGYVDKWLDRADEASQQQPAAVNILGAGLIKRKVPDVTATTQPPVAVNVLGAGLIKRKAPASTPVGDQPSSQSSTASTPSGSTAVGTPESSTSAPVVNVLGASFIKKRKIDP
ncbi:MAG: histone acetylation protein-domain-containing protein [Benniella sp.]|nr:MAG: histone acetylation protein-domain-containing protein [Benniella sp.]